MVHFLHTLPVEVFMIILVILDVIIILAMIAMAMTILEGMLPLTA